jgi:hypothetical protein
MAFTSRSRKNRAVFSGSRRSVWPATRSISAVGEEYRTLPSITETMLQRSCASRRMRAPRMKITCAPGTANESESLFLGSPVKYAKP